MEEKVQKLLAIIALLPPKLADQLENYVAQFVAVMAKFHSLPEPIRGKIANIFGHNILAIIKKAKADSADNRALLVYWLITIADLDPEWKPGFPMTPPS